MENTTTTKTTTKKRAGRTLLVSNVPEDMPLAFEGIKNVHKTSNGSQFLYFDSLEHAEKAYQELSDTDVRVKYSYYRVFFRLREFDLTKLKYDEMKESIRNKLTSLNENINVLYFKFYTKNNQLIGSGDFTLDSKDDLDSLVTLREIEVEGGKVSLYRYRMKSRNFNRSRQV